MREKIGIIHRHGHSRHETNRRTTEPKACDKRQAHTVKNFHISFFLTMMMIEMGQNLGIGNICWIRSSSCLLMLVGWLLLWMCFVEIFKSLQEELECPIIFFEILVWRARRLSRVIEKIRRECSTVDHHHHLKQLTQLNNMMSKVRKHSTPTFAFARRLGHPLHYPPKPVHLECFTQNERRAYQGRRTRIQITTA